ncbi:R2DM Retrovirus-related Pol polyprotein from type II retrotransposable element [Takifugu flavidus]|uniref:R2DM Retrovirus-related Pol polyprotein from type II retrotransposable element n=1 Tax=Takifugu flavidus TaxID=433684 RepID=A0A5C6NVM0_9TELE|nr:R2DM Retrovirus-related Pol polyprotein from type II retrotransposable element [Takifugu flavidus]
MFGGNQAPLFTSQCSPCSAACWGQQQAVGGFQQLRQSNNSGGSPEDSGNSTRCGPLLSKHAGSTDTKCYDPKCSPDQHSHYVRVDKWNEGGHRQLHWQLETFGNITEKLIPEAFSPEMYLRTGNIQNSELENQRQELCCLGLYAPGRGSHGKQVLGLGVGHVGKRLVAGPLPMESGRAHPEEATWDPLPVGSPPAGGAKGVSGEGYHQAEEGVISGLTGLFGTPEAADRYQQTKRSGATAVDKAKTRAWEEFGEAMESDFRTTSKRMVWIGGRNTSRTSSIPPTPSNEEAGPGDLGIGSHISGAEVAEVGKAPGVDEIRPEFLKALDVIGLSWLTRLCNIAWTSGAKRDRRVCSNYRGITLLSLPGKVFSGVLERRVRQIVEPRIPEEQCGFHLGRETVDHLYTLSRVFEGAWEFAQPVHMCFVDLKKAFNRVPWGVLWGVLREYGVPDPLIWAVRSLYDRCQSLVRIAGSKSNSFLVRVSLRQGCPLSLILFVTFMDRISTCSHGVEGVRFGKLRIGSLLFADDVVLLASSARDLQ